MNSISNSNMSCFSLFFRLNYEVVHLFVKFLHYLTGEWWTEAGILLRPLLLCLVSTQACLSLQLVNVSLDGATDL